MPKRDDIQTILVIDQVQLSSDKPQNLITQVHKRV